MKQSQIEIYQAIGNNDPLTVEFFEHGRSLSGLVSILLENQQWEQAIATASQAREIVEASKNRDYRGPGKFVLALLCGYRAKAFEKLERHEDAKQELTDLLGFGKLGVPVGVDCGWLHTQIMVCRADVFLGDIQGALDRATEIIEDKENLGSKRSGMSRVILEAAGAFALAADILAMDQSLDESTKEPLVQQHRDRAVELIRLALERDDFLAPLNRSAVEFVEHRIHKDTAFNSIRDLQEVNVLLAQERKE